jgi:outer membrane receptor protein involved in Fe transport
MAGDDAAKQYVASSRARLLASTVICGALSLGMTATAAAQTAPAAVGEVVVTGTRIVTASAAVASPVVTLSHDDIQLSGLSRVEDIISQLPQAFALQGGTIGAGASGTATANLRDLDPQRTLVLIDGRRMLPGDPGYAGNPPVADLNFIPASLIQRIDVLTGGASATYGADAVAGVVNFVMQKNFTGVRLDANAGFFAHDNADNMVQALQAARGIASPKGMKADGWQKDVTLTFGANTPDSKGNATVYGGYRETDAVSQAQRDFSNCPLGESGAGFACLGSGSGVLPHFYVVGPAGIVGAADGYILDATGPGNTLRPYVAAGDSYNFRPFNTLQRPDQRYTAGLMAHYEVNPHADLYGQAMFMDDRTSYSAAPAGLFGQQAAVPCADPLFSAQEFATFCTQAGHSIRGATTLALMLRNPTGPRVTRVQHTDYRLVAGARGDIDGTWKYDAYIQYGEARMKENEQNDFSLSRFVNAAFGCLQSVPNPSGAACALYNPFAIGGASRAAVDYVTASEAESGVTVEQVASASLTGKLGDYGLRTPWSAAGVDVNIGAEYRREALNLNTEASVQAGDLTGIGGVRVPVSGAYDVKEVFAEAQIPIVQAKTGFQNLSLNAGYRHSDYSLSGVTGTYKIGGEWAPTDDFKLRASYNRAERAPNIDELFAPSGVLLDGTTDPCSGAAPSASAAQCALTGVSAAQYGHIAANPSRQYNGLEGGNPDLKTEIADTVSYGLVFTPRFIPGLAVSIDHFDIKVSNVIGSAGADLIITQCVQTGDPFYCSKINRAPGSGSLWLTNAGYIRDTQFNLGQFRTQGVDISASYRVPLAAMGLDRFGRLDVALDGTLLDSLVTQPLPTGGSFDCAGRYGTICLMPAPKWKHKARASWQTPWDVAGTLTWRHIGGVDVDRASSNSFLAGPVDAVDAKLKAVDYFDLVATWRVKANYTLRLGANNVFDVEPPLVGSNHLAPVFGNGSTYSQVYDTLGRYLFVGLTAQF